jgi:hypothetical protein
MVDIEVVGRGRETSLTSDLTASKDIRVCEIDNADKRQGRVSRGLGILEEAGASVVEE